MISRILTVLAFSFAFVLPVHADQIRVPGAVNGFTDVGADDMITGAIVIPTLRADRLLRFDFDGFMAPKEEMKAGPLTLKVPGNLFIPEQDETYGIFPITIRKDSFGFYTAPGASEEIFALSFQGPFGDLVKKIKNKASYAEILPLITIKGFAFAGKRDWSKEASIPLDLSLPYEKTHPYTWNRSTPAPDRAFDAIVSFQKTAASRWVLADLVANPSTTGNLAGIRSLGAGGEMKVLFARFFNDEKNVPMAANGFFRAGNQSSSFTAEDVPASIAGTSVQGTHVTWNPIRSSGWVAVLRQSGKTKFGKGGSDAPFSALHFIFSKLSLGAGKFEAWISPSAGAFELGAPLAKGEKVVLIFIGTDRDVSAPTSGDEAEPALLTYANQLSMVRVETLSR